jgi:hypothetical protein
MHRKKGEEEKRHVKDGRSNFELKSNNLLHADGDNAIHSIRWSLRLSVTLSISEISNDRGQM